MTQVTIEDLLGQYWDLAYREGCEGVSHGNKANEVLFAIRAALQAAPAQPINQVLVDALKQFADALPPNRDTVKTCYAVTNGMRDAAHAALAQAQAQPAQGLTDGAVECEHCCGTGKILVHGREESWHETCVHCYAPTAQTQPVEVDSVDIDATYTLTHTQVLFVKRNSTDYRVRTFLDCLTPNAPLAKGLTDASVKYAKGADQVWFANRHNSQKGQQS